MPKLVLPLLALLLILTATGHAGAQQESSLAVEPPTLAVDLGGGSFELLVTVDEVTNEDGLGGYTLVMTYDPDVLHALTVTDSGFVASTENAVICPASAVDNDDGRLAHFCFTIPILSEPGPQTSEPRPLVRITFEPVGEGVTTIGIGETSVIDPQGNGLIATTTDGEVIVRRGSGQPAPTDRPTDTSPTTDTEPAATGQPNGSDTGLPTSGTSEGGSDRTVQNIALILVGIGSIVLVSVVLYLRVGRRAS